MTTSARQRQSRALNPFRLLFLGSLLFLALALFLQPAFLPRLRQLSNQLLPHRFFSASTAAMAAPYAHELLVAQLAVQRAAILTKRVFHEKAKGTVDKNDKSPVRLSSSPPCAITSPKMLSSPRRRLRSSRRTRTSSRPSGTSSSRRS
jgi:hypothetical protein